MYCCIFSILYIAITQRGFYNYRVSAGQNIDTYVNAVDRVHTKEYANW
jgi:hypothetical protein